MKKESIEDVKIGKIGWHQAAISIASAFIWGIVGGLQLQVAISIASTFMWGIANFR